jgi:hypothetical protein
MWFSKLMFTVSISLFKKVNFFWVWAIAKLQTVVKIIFLERTFKHDKLGFAQK